MLYRRGEIWWYRFRFAGRVYRESSKSTSKEVARRAELKRHRELEEGYHGITRRPRPVTFSVAADDWLKLKKPILAASSYRNHRTDLGHLAPEFGSLLITDIRPDDVARYQQQRLSQRASPKTVNLEIGTLRAILRRHRLWADLQPDVRTLPTRDDVGVAISADEEARLLKACVESRSQALPIAVTLALHTGMRSSEILALRWRQVDLAGRRLSVGKSKTAAGTGRVIPLNSSAVAALDMWSTRFPDRQPDHFVFAAERYGIAGNTRALAAYHTDPTKHLKSVKEAWTLAKERAQVRCRFHDLRHTVVTRMLEGGAPLPVVGTIFGWSAATMVRMMKRYGHIGNIAQRQAVDLLSPTTVNPPAEDQPRHETREQVVTH